MERVVDVDLDDGRVFDHGHARTLAPLYAAVLGGAWAGLDPIVRRLHGGAGRARGTFRVVGGRGWLARAVAACLGLPRPGAEVPVTLVVAASERGERWMRSFGGRWVRTWQHLHRGLLVEATRFWRLSFRVRPAGGGLVFDQVAARFGVGRLAVRVPRCAAPAIRGRVEPAGAGVRVRIEVAAPAAGLVIAYDGVVTPIDEGGP